MPEVHRYQVVTMLSMAGATIGYDPHGPDVVMASDFDNAIRLFLDAAERCIASERREKELQQRLTAADERVDVLNSALEGMLEYFPEGYSDGECFSVERAKAALKPAAGSTRPTCIWSHDEIGIWAGSCGTKWAFTDDGPIENGMHFCHSCGKTLVVEETEDA